MRFSEFVDRLRYSSVKMPSSAEERKKIYIFFALFVFFASAAFISMGNFVWLNEVNQSDVFTASGSSGPSAEAITKVENIKNKNMAYQHYKTKSERILVLAEALGQPPITELNMGEGLGGGALAVPDFVPDVSIKALIVMDSGKAATLNIDGETPGQIFQQGAAFGNGKGKIIGIDSNGVSWTWLNKKHRTDL